MVMPITRNLSTYGKWHFLDIFLIIYLDDMLIYSKIQEEHDMHVRKVLQRLKNFGLYAKLE